MRESDIIESCNRALEVGSATPEASFLLGSWAKRHPSILSTFRDHRAGLVYATCEGAIYAISGGSRKANWFRNTLEKEFGSMV